MAQIFHRTLIYVPVKQTELVCLRVTINKASIEFSVPQEKGERGEAGGIALLESLHHQLHGDNIVHTTEERDMHGNGLMRIDKVSITIIKGSAAPKKQSV